MTHQTPLDLDRLRGAIRSASDPGERIQRVDLDGASYWVKRVERLSLRWRLQKGDGARALERERRAYHDLGNRGLPVAELVDEGSDHLVVRDAGQPLSKIVADPAIPSDVRSNILMVAAEALHSLHAAGVAHGRPSLRDMMWDGDRVTFIDFERYRTPRDPRRAQALDLILFAFSCYEAAGRADPQVEAALEHYRQRDTAGIWPAAARRLARLRWFERLVLAVPRLRRSGDVRAGALVFARFRAAA